MSFGYIIFPDSVQSTKPDKNMVLSVTYSCKYYRPME